MQEIDALLDERVRSRRVPARLRRLRRARTRSGTRSRSRRGSSTNGIPASLVHPRAAVLRAVDGRRAARSSVAARARWRSSATRSRPTTSARPARSSRPRQPATTCASTASPAEDFNSYGARRGNHEVMVRGTFANVRIRNLMVPGVEGGVTRHQPDGERMGIYDAAERYRAEGVPLIVIAGQDYGAGSSRDWAAKGTRLLGVRAVIARGFERIHRSNLIGMGVLPCQLPEGVSAKTLGLDGTERFDLVAERAAAAAPIRRHLASNAATAGRDSVPLVLRIDTPIEVGLLLGRRHPALRARAVAGQTQARSRASGRGHDSDQAHVRPARARRRPSNPGRAPVAARHEEGGARGGRVDEGGRAQHGAAEVVRPSSRAMGRISAALPGRAERERGRLEADPRSQRARHGDAALQRARHASQRRHRVARLPGRATGEAPGQARSAGAAARLGRRCDARIGRGAQAWQSAKTLSLIPARDEPTEQFRSRG